MKDANPTYPKNLRTTAVHPWQLKILKKALHLFKKSTPKFLRAFKYYNENHVYLKLFMSAQSPEKKICYENEQKKSFSH